MSEATVVNPMPPAGGANPFVPESLETAEASLRRIRRGLTESDPLPQAVGVGLSGGGIRSATFCLGVFQALARRRLLGSVDYLSTVSGGGYFGSFLGRLFGRDFVKQVAEVEEALGAAPSEPASDPLLRRILPWLRENGRYLSPAGSGDLLQMLAVILRNWVAMHLTLTSVVLLAAFLLVGLRALVEPLAEGLPLDYRWLGQPRAFSVGEGWWLSPFWVVAAAIFAFGAFPMGWAYWLLESPSNESIPRRAGRGALWLVGVIGPGVLVAWALQAKGGAIPMVGLVAFLLVAAVAVLVLRLLSLLAARLGLAARWSAPRQVPPLVAVACVSVLLGYAYLLGRSLLATLGGFILAALFFSWLWSRRAFMSERGTQADRDALARNRLTSGLRVCLVATVGLLGVTLVDSLAETIYRRGQGVPGVGSAALAALLGALSAIAAPAAKFVPLLLRPSKGRGGGSLLKPLATAVAGLVVVLALTAAFLFAHGLRWQFGAVRPWQPPPLIWLVVGTGAAALFALLFGATWSFLNSSSQLPFYKARLARAYLGASNRERLAGATGVSAVVAGDDIDLLEHLGVPTWCRAKRSAGEPRAEPREPRAAALASGAPLHLLNVTINCTRESDSQVERQDRKGLGLCLGPGGMSAGVHDHVVFDREAVSDGGALPDVGEQGPWIPLAYPSVAEAHESPFRVVGAGSRGKARAWLTVEPLTLGQWTAISGAAFTTGTGYRTSLGLSLLAGFGNVRLGYWWNSRRVSSKGSWAARIVRRAFAVQEYLRREFLAQFPGTSRQHWYLSDGGHFENLGGYELIRRRLPLIVLLDAEADPDFEFGGLADLVRKARIDFGAEVRFLDGEELDDLLELDPETRRRVGTLQQIGRAADATQAATSSSHGGERHRERRHAALAVVTYPESPVWSLLLYVKASTSGDESLDLGQYERKHPAFPHEPTSDQFFDEAQWESYRKLGEHVGEVVLAPGAPWYPDDFELPTSEPWQQLLARLSRRGAP